MTGDNLARAIAAAKLVAIEEAAALARLEQLVDSDPFRIAVTLLYKTEGTVVILGMGKSAIVAQKIAATMISTGTAARYLHAGDALHGDLGAIGKKDVVIAISKSGETRETLSILPFLRDQGNKVIALTNDEKSSLAKGADVTLVMGVKSEACPLNLAPMTSTTVTLAIGDALAAALIVAKDFKPEHFARFHPGGKLGWLLTAKVSDMIDSANNPVLPESATLKDAVVKLVESRLGGVSIVDESGRLVGVITDGDMKRVLLTGDDWQSILVVSVMKKEPVSVLLSTSAADALDLMERRETQISVLPVINDSNAPVGMLRIHDVIQSHL